MIPLGLKNAPATFQHIINEAMTGLIRTEFLLYPDDVVIFSRNFESHLKLQKMQYRWSKYQLTIQINLVF